MKKGSNIQKNKLKKWKIFQLENITKTVEIHKLAGISISALTNQGLFAIANEAKKRTEEAEANQAKMLNEYEDELNKYLPNGNDVKKVADNIGKVLSTTNNTELQDEKGNKIVVPAGFKITNDATTVDQGIVIEDANDASTLKNYENKAIAKNITNFKNSVEKNGGYYIGRYEARTTKARSLKDDALTQITEKGTDQVYNYVTQQQAAQQAQNMYNNLKFTSDLINSYAWDTAITFIQKCTDQTNYANQNSLNDSLSQTGTNTLTETNKIDKQCNIFDMASNIFEWTTETSYSSNLPCVGRGGGYNYGNGYMSYRNDLGTSGSNFDFGFRPLLYVNV